MKIYVGNLNYQTTDEDLSTPFQPYGEVTSANVIVDHNTGRSKGFGFVEIPDKEQALAAIEALNGTEIQGRTIIVNESRPRESGSGGRGSGGGGRFGGGKSDDRRRGGGSGGFGGGRGRY